MYIDTIFYLLRALMSYQNNCNNILLHRDYHHLIRPQIKIAISNMIPHLLRLLGSNRAPLTEFVSQRWVDAKRGLDIEWQQAPDTPHIFLGLSSIKISLCN